MAPAAKRTSWGYALATAVGSCLIATVITGLLALLLSSLLKRTAQVEEEVGLRTTELRESEARLQAIIDLSPALIFVKDLEGRYVLVNRAFRS